jgi:hypothetical protein
MQSDLENLESQGPGDDELQSRINALKENIQSIKSTVIGSCGNTPAESIAVFFPVTTQAPTQPPGKFFFSFL